MARIFWYQMKLRWSFDVSQILEFYNQQKASEIIYLLIDQKCKNGDKQSIIIYIFKDVTYQINY